ncbi:MAG TPA: glycosyltransferase family 2 protein [Solirubrobacterales bacterium]
MTASPDTAAGAPEVAVVIATRARETRLAFALEALAQQTLDPGRFEVIVVRAAAPDAALAAAPGGLRARFLDHRGPPGAAAQRNAGWRATRAPLVAFIDDDCRPTAGWLAAVLAAAGDEATIVQGRIETDPGERHLLYGLARGHEITGPSPRYEAGNIAYPRALLERVGGFDESYSGYAWGEDTDLGVRAVAAGAELAYADDALVWHAVIPRTLLAAVGESRRYASLVRLLARYPGLRRRLYPHGVVKASHPLLLLALAGLAVGGRRRALVLAVPYLLWHLRLGAVRPTPRRLARFALHLPAVAVSDLAELAVTLAAAARHRVPVL